MPEKSWIKKEYCFLYDKKTPSLQNSEEDDSYRVTTSIHLHLTVQTLSGTVIPYRYNRRILSQPYQKSVVRCASQKPCSIGIHTSPLSSGRQQYASPLWEFSVVSPRMYSLRHCVWLVDGLAPSD